MMCPILLTVGLSAIWVYHRTCDEVYRLTWIAVSFLALVWGYVISPISIQWLSIILICLYLFMFMFKFYKYNN